MDDDETMRVHRDRFYAELVSRLLSEGIPADVVFAVADAWRKAIDEWDAHIRRLPPSEG